jgi:hypothetical protein
MIWGNLWAWAGVITIGLPIVIHLLGRDSAPRHSFPTLRFLDSANLLPARRTRLHDLALLAVRIYILVAAVAALAQPLLLTTRRRIALDNDLARAIIVDTSASMHRPTGAGETAIVAARREAARVARKARTSVILETSSPSSAIAGAAAWLSRQSSRRELVVVSDFQLGAIDSGDIANVPPTIGVQPLRISVRTADSTEARLASSGGVIAARAEVRDDRTNVMWSESAASAKDQTIDRFPTVLAGSGERASADAASSAANGIAVGLPFDTTVGVALVYPDFEQRAELLRRAKTPSSPRLIALAARVRADSLLSAASHEAPSSDADVVSAATVAAGAIPRGLVVARASDGHPVVIAMQDSTRGHERLLLFSLVDAGSLTSAALIAAVRRAVSLAPTFAELEPATLSDSVLSMWRRAPAVERSGSHDETSDGLSDGRWLWVVVLALIALESWVRRQRKERLSSATQTMTDRAA